MKAIYGDNKYRMRAFIDLIEAASKTGLITITTQQAVDRKLFGPLYHGTGPENMNSILQHGFQIGGDDIKSVNGYQQGAYVGTAFPPPMHHLGYGVYLTTAKAVAKKFAGARAKMVEFYVDAPRLETINFGANNTMMRWWLSQGYDFDWKRVTKTGETDYRAPRFGAEWARATRHLTDTLKGQFDAVWFKGKGLRRLLDGDQVCVYDPARLYRIDDAGATAMSLNSLVTHNQELLRYDNHHVAKTDSGATLIQTEIGTTIHYIPPPGMKGMIVGKREITDRVRSFLPARLHNSADFFYEVKWAKGGTQMNYLGAELEPVVRSK